MNETSNEPSNKLSNLQSSSSQAKIQLKDISQELAESLRDSQMTEITESTASILQQTISHKDLTIVGEPGGCLAAFAILIASKRVSDIKERSFLISDNEEMIERFFRMALALDIPCAKLGGRNGGRGQHRTQNASLFFGRAESFLNALDDGSIEGTRIGRVIIIESETSAKEGRLEEILNLLHDLPKTQLIYIGENQQMGIANLIKKFFKSTEKISIAESDRIDEQNILKSRGGSRPDRSNSRNQEYVRKEVADNNQANSSEENLSTSSSHAVADAVELPKEMPVNFQHLIFELPSDVFARPNALCDFIEGEGSPATVVFCNSPSDADLSDVVLRKRGITSRKLIGFVTPAKLSTAIQAQKSGEVVVLVVTDISARDARFEGVKLVINYSIHSDPEIYSQRVIRASLSNPSGGKVASFVTPLDIANLHFLKKSLSINFETGVLPSPETLAAKKLTTMIDQAASKGLYQQAKTKVAVDAILASDKKNEVIAYLLNNTLEIIPTLMAQSKRHSDRYEEGDESFGGGRRGRGAGRNGRRDRYGDQRGSRNDANSGEDGSYDSNARSDTRESGDYRSRDNLTPRLPTTRDYRIYLGQGSKQGVSAEHLRELLNKSGDFPIDQIKRISVRDIYSFVDVPEPLGDLLMNKLGEAELKGGNKLFAQKALLIPNLREAQAPAPTAAQAGEVA